MNERPHVLALGQHLLPHTLSVSQHVPLRAPELMHDWLGLQQLVKLPQGVGQKLTTVWLVEVSGLGEGEGETARGNKREMKETRAEGDRTYRVAL